MVLELGTLVEDRLRRASIIIESGDNDEATALMNGDWEIKSEQIWHSIISARDNETMHQRVLSVTEDGEPLERKKIEGEIKKLNDNSEKDRNRRKFKEPLDTLHYEDYEFSITGTVNPDTGVNPAGTAEWLPIMTCILTIRGCVRSGLPGVPTPIVPLGAEK